MTRRVLASADASENAFPRLFSPVAIGGMTLKNRVMTAPMECNLANDDGSVSDPEPDCHR